VIPDVDDVDAPVVHHVRGPLAHVQMAGAGNFHADRRARLRRISEVDGEEEVAVQTADQALGGTDDRAANLRVMPEFRRVQGVGDVEDVQSVVHQGRQDVAVNVHVAGGGHRDRSDLLRRRGVGEIPDQTAGIVPGRNQQVIAASGHGARHDISAGQIGVQIYTRGWNRRRRFGCRVHDAESIASVDVEYPVAPGADGFPGPDAIHIHAPADLAGIQGVRVDVLEVGSAAELIIPGVFEVIDVIPDPRIEGADLVVRTDGIDAQPGEVADPARMQDRVRAVHDRRSREIDIAGIPPHVSVPDRLIAVETDRDRRGSVEVHVDPVAHTPGPAEHDIRGPEEQAVARRDRIRGIGDIVDIHREVTRPGVPIRHIGFEYPDLVPPVHAAKHPRPAIELEQVRRPENRRRRGIADIEDDQVRLRLDTIVHPGHEPAAPARQIAETRLCRIQLEFVHGGQRRRRGIARVQTEQELAGFDPGQREEISGGRSQFHRGFQRHRPEHRRILIPDRPDQDQSLEGIGDDQQIAVAEDVVDVLVIPDRRGPPRRLRIGKIPDLHIGRRAAVAGLHHGRVAIAEHLGLQAVPRQLGFPQRAVVEVEIVVGQGRGRRADQQQQQTDIQYEPAAIDHGGPP